MDCAKVTTMSLFTSSGGKQFQTDEDVHSCCVELDQHATKTSSLLESKSSQSAEISLLQSLVSILKIVCVLAIFVLLLTAAVSEEFAINSTFEEYKSTTLDGLDEDIQTVRLMQLPFASSLVNPCSGSGSNRPTYTAAEGHRASFTVEFFRFISHYASIYKEDAEEVLRNHTIHGCVTLHVANLPETPTFEELQEMSTEAALNKIYSSLLTHSAYAYFIHYQFNNSALKCSEDIYGEETLSNRSLQLARKQKSLACYVRVGIAVLGYTQNDFTSLLNETVTDLALCSRRALRDCQVITSIYNVLQSIADYAADLS